MISFGRRFPRRGRGFWFGFAIDVLWPLLILSTRFRVRGAENLPKTGGVLVASNHLSFADPATVTVFCLGRKRLPRFLAKSSLWNIPLMGAIMRSGKHIPVFRGLTRPGDTYRDAVASVNSGECVVVFPEATFSNREDLWPMRGKTGVARIALASGVPVIPVANWGTHRLLPTKSLLPRIFPRTTVDLLAGPAVDLSDLACDDPSREVLELATARIMAAITALLGELRREEPPA